MNLTTFITLLAKLAEINEITVIFYFSLFILAVLIIKKLTKRKEKIGNKTSGITMLQLIGKDIKYRGPLFGAMLIVLLTHFKNNKKKDS